MTIMAKKRKKKGRPSLLDLQKRSLKQQQQLQKQNQNPNSLNFSSNPTKRSDSASLPPPEFFTTEDDDDDERKEKKHKLLLGFNSNADGLHCPTLSSFDKNVGGGDDPDDVEHKRRKISAAAVAYHGSNQMSEKALKATDSSCSVHGLQVETGPTTPLPDKKLLVFILDRLQKKDTYGVFSEPVDPEELPDYHEMIENPMDFGTVRKKLDSGAYTNLEQFEVCMRQNPLIHLLVSLSREFDVMKDVFLICSNAMEYNSSDTIYFRQARSIHELAKKDFENLRQDSDDDDEPQPKIERRGRPPGKKVKKPIESSPVDCVGHELFSEVALASGEENANGSNTYNLRRVRNRPADAVNGVFHGSLSAETGTSWLSEWENEFPASVLRSVLKNGKKQFPVDENKRDTYRFPLSFRNEPSTLAVFEGERKQLVEVGDAYLEHSYARSIGRFAADLGPVVWKIALKKIESILPIELKFGRGWIEEREVSKNEKSIFCEAVIPNPAAYDLTISRLLPQSISGSNSVGSDKFFMQGREDMETLARFTHNELATLNSNVVGTRTMTIAPFQFQQNSAVQPWINGSNNGPESYILPQMGISPPTTLMGGSSQAEASVPPQMLGLASTTNTIVGGINDTDSSEPNLLMNTSSSDYGNFLPHGSSGFGLFRVPASGFVGEASLQGWAMPHNQDSHHPFPSDLNERFRAPGSPTSLVRPDLALQLTMGR